MKNIAERAGKVFIGDKSKVFNTARVEAMELEKPGRDRNGDGGVGGSAQGKPRRARQERFPRARRQELMKHTLWFKEGNRLDYRPVHLRPLSVETMEPKVRTY